MAKLLKIDFTDIDAMREVMRTHAGKNAIGTNESGEEVIVMVSSDHITASTFQHNGWIRNNVFWEDGTTEELYEKDEADYRYKEKE